MSCHCEAYQKQKNPVIEEVNGSPIKTLQNDGKDKKEPVTTVMKEIHHSEVYFTEEDQVRGSTYLID